MPVTDIFSTDLIELCTNYGLLHFNFSDIFHK